LPLYDYQNVLTTNKDKAIETWNDYVITYENSMKDIPNKTKQKFQQLIGDKRITLEHQIDNEEKKLISENEKIIKSLNSHLSHTINIFKSCLNTISLPLNEQEIQNSLQKSYDSTIASWRSGLIWKNNQFLQDKYKELENQISTKKIKFHELNEKESKTVSKQWLKTEFNKLNTQNLSFAEFVKLTEEMIQAYKNKKLGLEPVKKIMLDKFDNDKIKPETERRRKLVHPEESKPKPQPKVHPKPKVQHEKGRCYTCNALSCNSCNRANCCCNSWKFCCKHCATCPN